MIRGQFSAAEFAADLYAVAHGHTAAPEYLNPAEFFSRTYLTSGLSDLLTRALKRLSGDAGASPVINLQTQFGGGKMLALYHLFAEGLATSALSQSVQDVVHASLPTAEDDPLRSLDVKRVTLVGTKLSPSQPIPKDDGAQVRTLWGSWPGNSEIARRSTAPQWPMRPAPTPATHWTPSYATSSPTARAC